jgi:hypothetical protein
MTSTTGYYQVHAGDIVLWDERLNGRVYAWDTAFEETYEIEYSQEMYDYTGRIFKLYENGTRPYLHWEFDFLPAYAAWLYANFKGAIEVWKMKFYLHQLYPTEYAAIIATIEATYATTPLNKIRWEQKELMTFGGILHNIIQDELGFTDFEMYELYKIDSVLGITLNYDDISENDVA